MHTNIRGLLEVASPYGMTCKVLKHLMHYYKIERTFQHCKYAVFHKSNAYVTWWKKKQTTTYSGNI